METSEAINELAGALAKAQGEIKGALKDATNPFFKSRYATLDAVWDACRGPLSANGLSIIQGASTPHEATVCVTTMLLHSSGQWIRDALTLPAGDGGPQETGSALTYARRYGLSAMVGVAPEDDDDANAAQGTKMPPRYQDKRFKGPQEGPPLSTDPKVIQAEEDKIFGKPNGAAAPPAVDPGLIEQLPEAFRTDTYALEMAIARLMQNRGVTATDEKLALSIAFLDKKSVPDATHMDKAKLYIFLNDPAGVADWRKELAKRKGAAK